MSTQNSLEVLSGSVSPKRFDQPVHDWPPAPFDILTGRELDVIELTSQGLNRKEIVEALSISFGHVTRSRAEILRTIGTLNMNHTVRVGCDRGLFVEPLETPPDMQVPTPGCLKAMELFSYGYNQKYVGRELQTTPDGARTRRVRAIHALGARTFAHAIRLAWQEGLLSS